MQHHARRPFRFARARVLFVTGSIRTAPLHTLRAFVHLNSLLPSASISSHARSFERHAALHFVQGIAGISCEFDNIAKREPSADLVWRGTGLAHSPAVTAGADVETPESP